jgi:CheY-like chemotaxis protein
VEIIERQARQLAHLLDDLLDMGRVLTGKIVLKRAPVEFGAIVRRALEHVTTATHVRQQVHVETAPVWIDADENRIEQIVTNMLTNAIKYTPDTGTIWITLTREREEALLRVRDDGVGLDADLLPIVFDLFVQAGRTLERAQGGLGIGLTLVRRLTELHGGSVGVRSDGPGRGSEFEIRLPSVPGFASATKPVLQTTVQPRKVLVVEDNADARDMISMLLTLRGHDVHAAPDGSTGVKVALEIRPHVALVDIGLPGIDGYEVARNIRTRLDGEIRLVAMTGYGLPEDRERARAAGFDEHIVKPVEEAELMRVIAGSASAAEGARPTANYPS